MYYFLGIDNGGTKTKSALFDRYGTELVSVSRDTPLIVTDEGFQERDMELLWETTSWTIRETLCRAGVPSRSIAGVGCTGHGKGLYLWGRDGRPAGRAIASTDRRAEALTAAWNASETARKASEKTMQPLDPCQPAALLAWLKQNQPSVYTSISWIFEAKDYIRFRLTGEARAEYTDSSGSSLMDLNSCRFDPELLELFGIPEMADCLPPLCRSDEVCGHITSSAARDTGLLAGTPVCGGMFDIDACALAMGVVDEDSLCVIAGTWGINEYISRSPVSDISTTRNSLYCIPGWYLIEESSPASAGNLEWVRTLLSGSGPVDYQELSRLVGSVPPEASGVLFAPYLYGSNVPGCDSGFFFGLNNSHTRADLLRAVYEGVVYTHRIHIERLLRHRTRPGSVRLSGGAAASAVWAQMFADVLGLPVDVVPVQEPGALGCAMAAAAAVGIYPSFQAAASAMAPALVRYWPDCSKTAVYEKKYQRYLRLLDAVKNI